MTNDQWLNVFKDIGRNIHEGLPEILNKEGGKIPLGKGAGGDKTYPIDKWAEDICISFLENVHRGGETFTLISEELGTKSFGKGTNIVLVDPIDGSNNAKSGVPFFSTALALLEGNTLSDLDVAYIVNLATRDEFWAIRGEGAYKNGMRIRTSASEPLIIIAYEASTPAKDIPPLMPIINQTKRARCFGSTALDLAYLASGAVSIFATAAASRSFDYAAGMLILHEAGGIMTDFSGKSLDTVAVGVNRTAPLLASANRQLHDLALSLLARKNK